MFSSLTEEEISEILAAGRTLLIEAPQEEQ